MAHEFSVALRAGCALLLPHGVLPRIENPLPALRTREVTFRSHARKGTCRRPPLATGAMDRHDPLRTESAEGFIAGKSRQCDLLCRRCRHSRATTASGAPVAGSGTLDRPPPVSLIAAGSWEQNYPGAGLIGACRPHTISTATAAAQV